VKIQAKFDISKWRAEGLLLIGHEVFRRYCFTIAPMLKAEISAVQYTDFPNITIRKHRPPVFNPRDIVDSGDFLESQSGPEFIGKTVCRFTWNVPYSSLILTGYVTPRGHIIPKRDWISPVTEHKLPMERFFEEQWKTLGLRP